MTTAYLNNVLEEDPEVLNLTEKVIGSSMRDRVPKGEGEDISQGPIHLSSMHKALSQLDSTVRKGVKLLSMYHTSIGDKDVVTLSEIVDLFPNLQELDLGRTNLRFPNPTQMRQLLAKLKLLIIEDTLLASYTGAYFFNTLSEEEVKKLNFASYEELFDTESNSFQHFVPQRLHQALIAGHKAFYEEQPLSMLVDESSVGNPAPALEGTYPNFPSDGSGATRPPHNPADSQPQHSLATNSSPPHGVPYNLAAPGQA
eukprot:m.234425 g.234425  ORF g.234425 m.234425 type:complete len:256 (-) comp19611_c0_seq2:97-864(-)